MSSIPLPKRSHELSPLEPDDDLRTPHRFGLERRFLPKRISELSPLESSDDDSDGNLKCKALSGSPEQSPYIPPSQRLHNRYDENNRNASNAAHQLLEVISEESGPTKPKNEDPSNLHSSIKSKCQSGYIESEKTKPTLSIFSKIMQTSQAKSSAIKPKSPIANNRQRATPSVGPIRKFSPFEEKLIEYGSDGNSTKTTSSTSSDDTNNRSTADVANKVESLAKIMVNCDLQDETPLKPSFQVPSTRRILSSHQRPNGMPNRRRPPLESEFRSQKVLFTTPTAVSRPTFALMSHIGLDDSLNCYKSPSGMQLCDVGQQQAVQNLSTNTGDREPVKHNNLPKPDDRLVTTGINAKDINTNEKELVIGKEIGAGETKTKTNNSSLHVNINGKSFSIGKQIGTGGSCNVFLGQFNNVEYAIKAVNLRADPSLIDGYVKEVKILASLQDKDKVVRLFEFAHVPSEQLLYMVMEKGDSDLRKILQDCRASLPLYTLLKYFYEMLEAVNYIHQKGIIHSDLKPENFLMVNGRLKLIDFGISSRIAPDATSIIKYSQAGTFNYISPETLMDISTGDSPISNAKIKISPKSDVWSLGCILYLLIYKTTPFGHIKNAIAKMKAIGDPNDPIKYAPLPNYYPKMLIEMAQLCLVRNPKERASVADLLAFPFEMVIPISK